MVSPITSLIDMIPHKSPLASNTGRYRMLLSLIMCMQDSMEFSGVIWAILYSMISFTLVSLEDLPIKSLCVHNLSRSLVLHTYPFQTRRQTQYFFGHESECIQHGRVYIHADDIFTAFRANMRYFFHY